MITARSTKAEILAAYTAVCADAQAQLHTIRALRDDLAMAQQPSLLPTGRATHQAYYDYLRTQRSEAKQRGLRVTTYKTYDAWAQGAAQ